MINHHKTTMNPMNSSSDRHHSDPQHSDPQPLQPPRRGHGGRRRGGMSGRLAPRRRPYQHLDQQQEANNEKGSI